LDYTILLEDYQRAGGQASSVDTLKRNADGEALNTCMYAVANTSNPVGLLGATYIIDGTGQRIIAHLMPRLRTRENVPHDALRFLHYHAENESAHLERGLDALRITLSPGSTGQRAHAARAIVDTATETAELYLMQMRASVRH
jgi:3-oxoacyl-[acyl-carrier-protein] synthase-3